MVRKTLLFHHIGIIKFTRCRTLYQTYNLFYSKCQYLLIALVAKLVFMKSNFYLLLKKGLFPIALYSCKYSLMVENEMKCSYLKLTVKVFGFCFNEYVCYQRG